MELFAGTSGYSYKEWKGPFYPEKIPNDEMLTFYATQLPSVEINNTFYRMPKASVVESWASQVPSSFRFVVKATQRITHFKRLRNCTEETRYLLETLQLLGDQLGVVLFQLPPNFRKDIDRLDDFLDDLPKGTRAAFEFRHDTWWDNEVFDLLSRHKMAVCIADTDEKPGELYPTADWGYLRLRRPGYSDDELREWLQAIRGAGWKEAYVFFKHEDAGAGPLMAKRFLELAVQ